MDLDDSTTLLERMGASSATLTERMDMSSDPDRRQRPGLCPPEKTRRITRAFSRGSEPIHSDQACVMADLVLSGFIRVVSHARVFRDPTTLDAALAFTAEVPTATTA